MIYLDHASQTPILDCAKEAFLAAPFGNPNSSHAVGAEARKCMEKAEETIFRCLGAKGYRCIFTSGASESAALAIKSMVDACQIVSVGNTEHHCVLEYPLAPEEFEKPYLYGYNRMLANNETGKIYAPLKIERGKDLWSCDGTAAIGHIAINLNSKDFRPDYFFGSAQKFGGIPGCGFLLVKDGVPLSQMIYGAPDRGGTPPVGLISAMAAALEWQTDYMEMNTERIESVVQSFLNGLAGNDIFFRDGMEWNLPEEVVVAEQYLPHILNIHFPGVEGNALVALCSNRGIMISAGAACSTGGNEPSHVLLAMGYSRERASQSVRISFSPFNTEQESFLAGKIVADCVKDLRSTF